MFVKSLAFFASAFASTSLAMGTISIKNQCPDSIHYQSLSGGGNAPINELQSNKDYSEQFHADTATGGGISIKVSKTPQLVEGQIAQVEYTLQNLSGKPMVFYDLSFVDGNPFVQDGVTITPSDNSCPTVNCPAGLQNCPDAYNLPHDDTATHGCSQEANFEVVFCSGGGNGNAKRGIQHRPWNATTTGSPSPTGSGAATTAQLPRHPHAKPDLE